MGNKFSGEKLKGVKEKDGQKKEKVHSELETNNRDLKSISPASGRESNAENRSSIETTDSYSSAATLVATAEAAIGKRSPQKSPRAGKTLLRNAISSDDESFVSAGSRTPRAATPLMKRAADPFSPSQRLMKLGRSIESNITEKLKNMPQSESHGDKCSSDKDKNVNKGKTEGSHIPVCVKDNREYMRTSVGHDEQLSSLPERCVKDVSIEADSNIFERTGRSCISLPKEYYPNNDNFSDDVFMSCIDLAANSPDIPMRSHTALFSRNVNQVHSSHATALRDIKTNISKSPKPSSKQSTSLSPPHKNTKEQLSQRTPDVNFPISPKLNKSSKKTSRKTPFEDPSSMSVALSNRDVKLEISSSHNLGKRNHLMNPPESNSERKSQNLISSKVNNENKVQNSKELGGSVGAPITSICFRAEEDNTQIKNSPELQKQEMIMFDMERKKEHLRSTYDNVPDSDDSMVYVFEDSCVSEEVILTGKTPLHHEVEKPQAVGIEIMKAPEQGKILIVIQELEQPELFTMEIENMATLLGSPRRKTVLKETYDPLKSVTKQPTISGAETPDFTESLQQTPSASNPNKVLPKTKNTTDATQALLNNTNNLNSKKEGLTTENFKQMASESEHLELGQMLGKSHRSPTSYKEAVFEIPNPQHTKQCQIQRRNKKKKQGNVYDNSDAPLCPTQFASGGPWVNNVTEMKESSTTGKYTTIEEIGESTQKTSDRKRETDTKGYQSFAVDFKGCEGTRKTTGKYTTIEEIGESTQKISDRKQETDTKGYQSFAEGFKGREWTTKAGAAQPKGANVKRATVSEESVNANVEQSRVGIEAITDEFGSISDKSNVESSTYPSAKHILLDKADEGEEAKIACDRTKIFFRENILKRLSSLVEYQYDSNEPDRRIQYDRGGDDVDQSGNSKQYLNILNEILDAGGKLERASEGINLKYKTEFPDLYHANIECQLNSEITPKTKSDVSQMYSENTSERIPRVTPEKDSQQITETINAYSEINTAINFSIMGHLPRSDISAIELKKPEVSIKKPRSSKDEELHSPSPSFSGDELSIPAVEDTFSKLSSVKNILQTMEDNASTAKALPNIFIAEGMPSPPRCIAGNVRRSRIPPAITERTGSELDIYDHLDSVSISTDSMYADDEDDSSEMAAIKTCTGDKGAVCLVSGTFYNESHNYDSDDFWADGEAAAERLIENSVNQATHTFKRARSEMHDIQRHLQDLRRQMEYLQDDAHEMNTLSTYSLCSSECRPITE